MRTIQWPRELIVGAFALAVLTVALAFCSPISAQETDGPEARPLPPECRSYHEEYLRAKNGYWAWRAMEYAEYTFSCLERHGVIERR